MSAVTVTPMHADRPGWVAVVENADVENLSQADFEIIEKAVYEHQVVCIKSYPELPPQAQLDLVQRFDPESHEYSHSNTGVSKKSVIQKDGRLLPATPQIALLGNGHVDDYYGIKDAQMTHPHHRVFHKTKISDEDDFEYTRFYRWHIDAAFFGKLKPPKVTGLFCVDTPPKRYQTLRYDDGTGDEVRVPLAGTAFASGYKMFDMLTPEQKEFAMTSKAEYAPHPFVWISGARSRSDGLGLESEGLETPDHLLPDLRSQDDIQVLPMCWQNPVTKQWALQIHPSMVRKIHLKDGTIIGDLKQARDIVHDLQRPGIGPDVVYAHDWEKGDLVMFNNHGVIHSVVGAFAEGETRLMRQCNIAGSQPVIGPEDA